VKNYLQFNVAFKNNRTAVSSYHVARQVWISKGIGSLWTGLGPTLFVVIPSNIIFFGVYERLKARGNLPSVSGIEARIAVVTVIAPMEYIRTKLQADMGSSGWVLAKHTMASEGIFSMWRGVLPTLLRDVPFSAIYWELNESIKSAIRRRDDHVETRNKVVTEFIYPFISASIAAAVASVATHPFDVVKTHLQSVERVHSVRGYVQMKRVTSGNILSQIYRKEGIRGFGVGLAPRLAKIVPSCAILLGTFEYTKHLFRYAQIDANRDW